MDDVWKKIQKEYIKGGKGVTQQSLAEKYGLSRSAVGDHCRAGKWREKRDKVAAKSAQKVTDAAEAEAMSEAARLHSAALDILAKTQEGLSKTDPENAAQLQRYASTLKGVMDMLGIKAPGDKAEQDARIAELRARAKERDREQDGGAKLVIEGLPEEYAK